MIEEKHSPKKQESTKDRLTRYCFRILNVIPVLNSLAQYIRHRNRLLAALHTRAFIGSALGGTATMIVLFSVLAAHQPLLLATFGLVGMWCLFGGLIWIGSCILKTLFAYTALFSMLPSSLRNHGSMFLFALKIGFVGDANGFEKLCTDQIIIPIGQTLERNPENIKKITRSKATENLIAPLIKLFDTLPERNSKDSKEKKKENKDPDISLNSNSRKQRVIFETFLEVTCDLNYSGGHPDLELKFRNQEFIWIKYLSKIKSYKNVKRRHITKEFMQDTFAIFAALHVYDSKQGPFHRSLLKENSEENSDRIFDIFDAYVHSKEIKNAIDKLEKSGLLNTDILDSIFTLPEYTSLMTDSYIAFKDPAQRSELTELTGNPEAVSAMKILQDAINKTKVPDSKIGGSTAENPLKKLVPQLMTVVLHNPSEAKHRVDSVVGLITSNLGQCCDKFLALLNTLYQGSKKSVSATPGNTGDTSLERRTRVGDEKKNIDPLISRTFIGLTTEDKSKGTDQNQGKNPIRTIADTIVKFMKDDINQIQQHEQLFKALKMLYNPWDNSVIEQNFKKSPDIVNTLIDLIKLDSRSSKPLEKVKAEEKLESKSEQESHLGPNTKKFISLIKELTKLQVQALAKKAPLIDIDDETLFVISDIQCFLPTITDSSKSLPYLDLVVEGVKKLSPLKDPEETDIATYMKVYQKAKAKNRLGESKLFKNIHSEEKARNVIIDHLKEKQITARKRNIELIKKLCAKSYNLETIKRARDAIIFLMKEGADFVPDQDYVIEECIISDEAIAEKADALISLLRDPRHSAIRAHCKEVCHILIAHKNNPDLDLTNEEYQEKLNTLSEICHLLEPGVRRSLSATLSSTEMQAKCKEKHDKVIALLANPTKPVADAKLPKMTEANFVKLLLIRLEQESENTYNELLKKQPEGAVEDPIENSFIVAFDKLLSWLGELQENKILNSNTVEAIHAYLFSLGLVDKAITEEVAELVTKVDEVAARLSRLFAKHSDKSTEKEIPPQLESKVKETTSFLSLSSVIVTDDSKSNPIRTLVTNFCNLSKNKIPLTAELARYLSDHVSKAEEFTDCLIQFKIQTKIKTEDLEKILKAENLSELEKPEEQKRNPLTDKAWTAFKQKLSMQEQKIAFIMAILTNSGHSETTIAIFSQLRVKNLHTDFNCILVSFGISPSSQSIPDPSGLAPPKNYADIITALAKLKYKNLLTATNQEIIHANNKNPIKIAEALILFHDNDLLITNTQMLIRDLSKKSSIVDPIDAAKALISLNECKDLIHSDLTKYSPDNLQLLVEAINLLRKYGIEMRKVPGLIFSLQNPNCAKNATIKLKNLLDGIPANNIIDILSNEQLMKSCMTTDEEASCIYSILKFLGDQKKLTPLTIQLVTKALTSKARTIQKIYSDLPQNLSKKMTKAETYLFLLGDQEIVDTLILLENPIWEKIFTSDQLQAFLDILMDEMNECEKFDQILEKIKKINLRLTPFLELSKEEMPNTIKKFKKFLVKETPTTKDSKEIAIAPKTSSITGEKITKAEEILKILVNDDRSKITQGLKRLGVQIVQKSSPPPAPEAKEKEKTKLPLSTITPEAPPSSTPSFFSSLSFREKTPKKETAALPPPPPSSKPPKPTAPPPPKPTSISIDLSGKTQALLTHRQKEKTDTAISDFLGRPVKTPEKESAHPT